MAGRTAMPIRFHQNPVLRRKFDLLEQAHLRLKIAFKLRKHRLKRLEIMLVAQPTRMFLDLKGWSLFEYEMVFFFLKRLLQVQT
jgi:hypothetical protein